MPLATPDYVVLAVTVAAAVLGMFGGFSGALAFLAGVFAAIASIRFGWELLEARISTPWMLSLAALACALAVFGLARAIVKRVVKNLLAQPADAIFGGVTAAVSGFSAALAVAYALDRFGVVAVDSAILREILSHVG